MPGSRRFAAAVAFDGKMMLIGGEFDEDEIVAQAGESTESVLLYDPTTNTWDEGTPLPTPRSGICATIHAGAPLVIGNGEPLTFVNGAWQAIQAMPGNRQGLSVCCVASVLLG